MWSFVVLKYVQERNSGHMDWLAQTVKERPVANIIHRKGISMYIFEIYMNYGYNLEEDIQVLAPMYKGLCGIDALNKSISDNFNRTYSYTVNSKEKVFKE